MWTYLLNGFGFITAAIGLLGIGAVLDASVPETRKRKVAQWADATLEQLRHRKLGGARLFDAVFGKKYISRRSLATSIGISIISATSFYLVAYFTSDETIREAIFPIQKELDIVGTLTILVYIPTLLFCDFLSYAQTRIFLSYIDKIGNTTISLILYVADMMFSIVIFIFGYSIARTIMTVIIAASYYSSPFERTATISPDVAIATYQSITGKKSFSGPISVEIPRVDAALKAYRASPSRSTENILITETIKLEYDDLSKIGGTVMDAKVTCLRDLSFSRENQTKTFEILKESDRLVLEKIGLPTSSISFNGRSPFYQHLAASGNASGTCPIYAVSAHINVKPKITLSNISWYEYFLGALATTINNLNDTVYTKMSSIPNDDPVAYTPTVLGLSLSAHNSHLLGIGATQNESSASLYLNNMASGSIRLPLGPLAASSLAANFLFGIYVLAIYSMAFGTFFLKQGWTAKFFKPNAVFVRISVGVVAVIISVFALVFLVNTALDCLIRFAIMKPLSV